MTGIRADHTDHAMALNDFAVAADAPNGCEDFHLLSFK
jgi:hypothetical protein